MKGGESFVADHVCFVINVDRVRMLPLYWPIFLNQSNSDGVFRVVCYYKVDYVCVCGCVPFWCKESSTWLCESAGNGFLYYLGWVTTFH